MRIAVKRLAVLAMPVSMILGAVPALAADNLNCIETGYDVTQTAAMNDFVRHFETSNFTGVGPLSETFEERLLAVAEIITVRSEQCADTQGWSEQATRRAEYYQLAGLLLRGMESSTLYSAEQLQRLRSGLASMDDAVHTRMREAFLQAATSNQVVQLQPREQRAFDALARRMGIAADDLQRLDGLRQWLRATFTREAVVAAFPEL